MLLQQIQKPKRKNKFKIIIHLDPSKNSILGGFIISKNG